jgi:hypothetical protein
MAEAPSPSEIPPRRGENAVDVLLPIRWECPCGRLAPKDPWEYRPIQTVVSAYQPLLRAEVAGGIRGERVLKAAHDDSEAALRALVGQAWELRETPYFHDALVAIETWFDSRHVEAFERKQERCAQLVRLLRETDPASLSRYAAA